MFKSILTMYVFVQIIALFIVVILAFRRIKLKKNEEQMKDKLEKL